MKFIKNNDDLLINCEHILYLKKKQIGDCYYVVIDDTFDHLFDVFHCREEAVRNEMFKRIIDFLDADTQKVFDVLEVMIEMKEEEKPHAQENRISYT